MTAHRTFLERVFRIRHTAISSQFCNSLPFVFSWLFHKQFARILAKGVKQFASHNLAHTVAHPHTHTHTYRETHAHRESQQFANVTVYVQLLTPATKKLNERGRRQ